MCEGTTWIKMNSVSCSMYWGCLFADHDLTNRLVKFQRLLLIFTRLNKRKGCPVKCVTSCVPSCIQYTQEICVVFYLLNTALIWKCIRLWENNILHIQDHCGGYKLCGKEWLLSLFQCYVNLISLTAITCEICLQSSTCIF